ncbi:cell wall-binding protein [Methanothermococcus sp. SCGC AD-155-E23]|nr:cell wall-binding protein [Methanothermococcus sp. SCGC AD-155-E23]
MDSRYLLIFLLLLPAVEGLVIGEERPSLLDTVVITNEKWPDCIAAVEYAHNMDGVILQTHGDRLDPTVESLVKAIAPKRIVIVGGPLAVSYDVEKRLKSYGDVIRVWGPTRVETREEVLKRVDEKKDLVLVNGTNFREALEVISWGYSPLYCFINIYDPEDVVRVYREDGIVELYSFKSRRLIGQYPRKYVLEIPGKILVLGRSPDMDVKFTNNRYIAKFGYKLLDLEGVPLDPSCGYLVVVEENTPSGVLLSRYLDIPVVYSSEDLEKEGVISFEKDPINSSVTVAVDILVLKRTLELYRRSGDLKQALYEAKTQLWSKNIPVERYNIPYPCLEMYVDGNFK